jgi:hypothetical protein
MKLWHKLGTGLVALSLAIFGFAVPAEATTLGCPSDAICLYQWLNFGAPPGDANPGWKSSYHNLIYGNAGCINLTSPAAYWPNGTQVWDNSASLVVNGSGAYGQQDGVSFYNSLNCNSNTGVISYDANWTSSESDLRTVPMGYGYYAYHTIASIGWRENCPPGGC